MADTDLTETAERVANAVAGIIAAATIPAGWDLTAEIPYHSPLADDVYALTDGGTRDYTVDDVVLRVAERELSGRWRDTDFRVEVSKLITDPHVVLSRPVHYAAARRTLVGSAVAEDLRLAWVRP